MTFDIAEEKRKRHRRTATEIARHYKCPVEECPKSYGYFIIRVLIPTIALKVPLINTSSSNTPSIISRCRPTTRIWQVFPRGTLLLTMGRTMENLLTVIATEEVVMVAYQMMTKRTRKVSQRTISAATSKGDEAMMILRKMNLTPGRLKSEEGNS